MNKLPLSTRKPRHDSVLKQLPTEKQRAIAEFARTRSLIKTCEWLAAQGIKTSKSSLGEFLSWFRPFQQDEAGLLVVMADLQAKHPEWSPEKIRAMGNSYFTACAIENLDFNTWFRMQALELRREEMQLSRDELEYARRKREWRKAGQGFDGQPLSP